MIPTEYDFICCRTALASDFSQSIVSTDLLPSLSCDIKCVNFVMNACIVCDLQLCNMNAAGIPGFFVYMNLINSSHLS